MTEAGAGHEGVSRAAGANGSGGLGGWRGLVEPATARAWLERAVAVCATLVVLFVPTSYWTLSAAGRGVELHDAVILVAFVAILMRVCVTRSIPVLDGVALWLAVALILTVAAFNILDPATAGNKVPALAALGLSFWCGMYLAGKWTFPAWAYVIAISSGASALIALGQFIDLVPIFDFTGTFKAKHPRIDVPWYPAGYAGVTGLIPTRGNYGIWLIAGLVGSVTLGHFFWARRRWLALGIAMVTVAMLTVAGLLSQSRSTMLALVVFAAGWLVLTVLVNARTRAETRRRIATLTPLLLVMGGAALWAAINALAGLDSETVGLRMLQYRAAFDQILENPLTGAGRIMRVAEQDGQVVHNYFLNILVSFGIVPFVLSVSIFGYAIASLVAGIWNGRSVEERLYRMVWLCGLAAVVCELMLFMGFYSKYLWAFLGLLFGDLARRRACTADAGVAGAADGGAHLSTFGVSDKR